MKLKKTNLLFLLFSIPYFSFSENQTIQNIAKEENTATSNQPVFLSQEEIQELFSKFTDEERATINEAFECIFQSVAKNLDEILTQDNDKKAIIEQAKKILDSKGVNFLINMVVQFIKSNPQKLEEKFSTEALSAVIPHTEETSTTAA